MNPLQFLWLKLRKRFSRTKTAIGDRRVIPSNWGKDIFPKSRR